MIRHIKKFIRWVFRSAETGKFVGRKFAEDHPDTTVRERVEN